MVITYSIGDHTSNFTRSVPWEHKDECGIDTDLTLLASSGEKGTITVVIYFDGNKEAEATGKWDPDTEKTYAWINIET